MTELEINKIIHEARGLCWHEYIQIEIGHQVAVECKCGELKWGYLFEHRNPSYTSSWSDYGEALEWASIQKWWLEFIKYWVSIGQLVRPLSGSTALAEFVVVHPKYFKKEVK